MKKIKINFKCAPKTKQKKTQMKSHCHQGCSIVDTAFLPESPYLLLGRSDLIWTEFADSGT